MQLPTVFCDTRKSMGFRDKKALVYAVKLVDIKSQMAIVDCRLFLGHSSKSSVFSCALWVHDIPAGRYASGVGSAGGGGYHKGSAAIEHALRDIGVSGFRSFSGAGYPAAITVLTELAGVLGYKDFLTVETYP
jgi:hypothetical protein